MIRGHELHMMALLPRSRGDAPRFLGSQRLDSLTVLAVALSLPSGDSLIAYFDQVDTLPLGLRITWTEPHVSVRWFDWYMQDSVRLFRQATFKQGDEEFHYRFDRIQLGPLPDSLFEAPESPEIGSPDT